MKTTPQAYRILVITLILCLLSSRPALTLSPGPPPQPAHLVYDEMRTVYLGNLARRDNGLPPLRWNAQMTEAARWFSWDSVENRSCCYCGHEDTLGRWPVQRMPDFGYQGYSGAENAYCGYVTPEQAISGWMASDGHGDNLLDPNSREIGLGYYRRESDGRGYVTQDFGHDPVYPPVVIEHEAITTTSPVVDLYIYDREDAGGFARLGPAIEMMVSNNPCFAGASWEPYTAHKSWTLESGTGWRAVYVKTRDAVGRTVVVSDTIYLGSSVSMEELGLHLAASTTDRVSLCGLEGGELGYTQLSQNWYADDTFDTFTLWWGNGGRVNDPAALGGTAFRLSPGDGESFAWVWTTEFFKETTFVAYFRLRASDNTSSDEVARISVEGGGTEYGPLSLSGTDFTAANTYQEFPIAFTFNSNPDDPWLTFSFWRSGQADIYVDGVYIFTPSRLVQPTLTWAVPGGNYRGGGIWARYTDGGGTFSAVEEAYLAPERISAYPESLVFLAEYAAPPPSPRTLQIQRWGCEPFTWSARDDASWLDALPVDETLEVSADTTGLPVDTYRATITVETDPEVMGNPVQIPVTLIVADHISQIHLPLILRSRSP
ncbi:MAG: CAP domain-containing protein [Anaerolineae bacterium]